MTALIKPAQARAYVNFSRWVADCPMECGGALELAPGMLLFACPECKTMSEIEWPPNADEIWEVLQERKVPRTRNWFPSGHVIALKGGYPHGQTPAQLRDETAENEVG